MNSTPDTTAHQDDRRHPPTSQRPPSAATFKQPSPTITRTPHLDQHILLCNTSPHRAKPSSIAASTPTTTMPTHTATSNYTPTKIIKRKTTTLHPTSIDHTQIRTTTLNSTHTHLHPPAPQAVFPSNSFTVPLANTDRGSICQPPTYPTLSITTSEQATPASSPFSPNNPHSSNPCLHPQPTPDLVSPINNLLVTTTIPKLTTDHMAILHPVIIALNTTPNHPGTLANHQNPPFQNHHTAELFTIMLAKFYTALEHAQKEFNEKMQQLAKSFAPLCLTPLHNPAHNQPESSTQLSLCPPPTPKLPTKQPAIHYY